MATEADQLKSARKSNASDAARVHRSASDRDGVRTSVM